MKHHPAPDDEPPATMAEALAIGAVMLGVPALVFALWIADRF